MDDMALEKVEIGKGRSPSKLRGAPYPRTTATHSNQDCKTYSRTRETTYHRVLSRKAEPKHTGMSESGWQCM